MRTQWTLVLTFALGMLKATQCCSQIENIPISEGVRIDKLYAGLLAETKVQSKSLSHGGFLSFQSGARIRLSVIPRIVSVRSFGVFRIVGGATTRHFTNFESIIGPGKKVAIHLGVMATPTTELRPNPVTWQSQVETHAESTLPGGRPGLKVHYQLTDSFKVTAGVHQQAGQPAYHLKLSLKKLAVSGFIKGDEFLIAARRIGRETELIASYEERSVAFSAIIHAFDPVSFYGDLAIDPVSKDRLFQRWGVRKYYSGDHSLRGFFSLSYDHLFNRVEGGFFLHL